MATPTRDHPLAERNSPRRRSPLIGCVLLSITQRRFYSRSHSKYLCLLDPAVMVED